MNFNFTHEYSIFLISINKNALYLDEWDAKSNTLIYEGHDAPINIAKEPKEKFKHSIPLLSGECDREIREH
jgi:hypothetical protein